jgi:hypothetical protein
MIIIWNKRITNENISYLIFPMLVGILSEIGQHYGIIAGTFDIMDILFYSFGGLSSTIIFIKSSTHEKTSTSLI